MSEMVGEMDLPARIVLRYAQEVRAGIFEAPPAMLTQIGAWIASLYAGHVLANVERLLTSENPGARDTSLSKAYEEMKANRARVPHDIDALKPGQIVKWKLYYANGKSSFVGVKYSTDKVRSVEHKYITSPPDDGLPLDPKLYAPVYDLGYGVAKLTFPRYRSWGLDGIIPRVQEQFDEAIKRMEPYLNGANLREMNKERFVQLLLLKKECLKYVSDAKSYRARATKEFPVDLTGWKYVSSGAPLIKNVNDAITLWNNQILSQVDIAKETLAIAQKAYDLAKKNPEDPEVEKTLRGLSDDKWLMPGRRIGPYWNAWKTRDAIRDGKRPNQAYVWTKTTNEGVPVEEALKLIEKPLGPNDIDRALAKSFGDKITVVTDFKGHEKTLGTWSPSDRTLTVDIRGGEAASVGYFRESLEDILRTLRHELQHVGQDVLTVLNALKSEAGTPSQDIRVPHKPNWERKPHALREEEFYTRLADEIARFVREAKKAKPGELRPLYEHWIHKVEFFKMLEASEPLKWRKAVSEFLKGIHAAGIDV